MMSVILLEFIFQKLLLIIICLTWHNLTFPGCKSACIHPSIHPSSEARIAPISPRGCYVFDRSSARFTWWLRFRAVTSYGAGGHRPPSFCPGPQLSLGIRFSEAPSWPSLLLSYHWNDWRLTTWHHWLYRPIITGHSRAAPHRIWRGRWPHLSKVGVLEGQI